MKPATPSRAPAASALPGGTPWRWKNRMLTAMRPALAGTARLMYDTASCSAYTGPSGSGTGEAPRVESAWVRRGTWAADQSEGDQPPRAVTELVEQLGQVEPGEPRDEDDDRHRRQDDAHDRLQGDPPELLEVGRLGAHPFGRVLAQLIEVDRPARARAAADGG